MSFFQMDSDIPLAPPHIPELTHLILQQLKHAWHTKGQNVPNQEPGKPCFCFLLGSLRNELEAA